MSELKKGVLNPMYNKVKSDAFLALQAKGKDNPRFRRQAISKEELANRYKKKSMFTIVSKSLLNVVLV